ncbi:hypothetical protein Tco_1140700 [Tanacetum coccineum]
MVNPGGELVRVQQLQVQLQAIQSENEHLKSKVVDCTMCQNLQAQVQELQSENDELKLSIEELTKAREIMEVILRQKDELISAQYYNPCFKEKKVYASVHLSLKKKRSLL